MRIFNGQTNAYIYGYCALPNNAAMANLLSWCPLAKAIAHRSSRWQFNWPMNSRY